MPRRTGHGWNFKQRHLVELGISGPFLLDTALISRVGWRVGLSKSFHGSRERCYARFLSQTATGTPRSCTVYYH